MPNPTSPRLAWLASRDIHTHEFTEEPANPRSFNHLGFGRWIAYVGKSVPAHEDSERIWANGDTEDDAIIRLAIGLKWELWREEELPAVSKNNQLTSMNLYRIIVLHGAPKDSHTSTETYLVAENEQEVFAWLNGKNYGAWTEEVAWLNGKNYGAWTEEVEEGEEPNMRYADDNETEIPFREWVMLKRGDLEDEEGWEDAYYGVTKWGWEPIAATPDEIATLVRLGIAVVGRAAAEGSADETGKSKSGAGSASESRSAHGEPSTNPNK